MSQDEWRSQVEIHKEVEILWICRLNITCEDHTCAVHEDVDAAKFLGNRRLHVEQLNVQSQVALDDQCLRWELLANVVKLLEIAAYERHFGSII